MKYELKYKSKYRSSKELEIYLDSLILLLEQSGALDGMSMMMRDLLSEDDKCLLDWFEARTPWPDQYKQIALAAEQLFPHNS